MDNDLTPLEQTLAELVAIPTISEDIQANEQALDYIQARLDAAGMHCERFLYKGHGLLLATTQPGVRQASVTLYAHVDVMAGTEKVFTLRKEGDCLYGRGTYDMKYAIAAYLHMAENMRGQLDQHDFAILIVTDEEAGGALGIVGLRDFLAAEHWQTQVCLMPDGARDWDIERAAKGWWRFELIATGQSAHASRPWDGDSASIKLIQALHELRLQFANQGPDTDTLNIGKIHGEGEGHYNQIPSHMAARVEIRMATPESQRSNEALIENLCQKYGITHKTDAIVDIAYQDTSHPIIQQYKRSVEAITGYYPQETLSLGGSDATYLNAVGVPCIITYLPGGGHHSENEWLSAPDFQKFPAVVQHFVESAAKR
jgi:succinyl-diaminopimelate desuccinylase